MIYSRSYRTLPPQGSVFWMFQFPLREVSLGCFSIPSGKCFWDVSEPPQGSGFGMFLYLRKWFWDVSVPKEVFLGCFSTPSGKCFWDVSVPPQGSGCHQ